MRLVKRGNVWRCDFVGLDGERRRVSTGERDERAAKLKALDIMREAMLDEMPVGERRALTSEATLQYALQRTLDDRWAKQRQGTAIAYRVGALQREIGHWKLSGVTFARLKDWSREREAEGDAPATINRKLSAIHTAMLEAAQRGEIGGLPPFPHFAENNVRERYLSRDEEAAVLRWIDARELAVVAAERPLWRYMSYLVPVLMDTGLRLSEALGLTAGNLGGNAVILRHGATKSGKGRQVPLTKRAQLALAGLLGHPLHGTVDANWAGRRWRAVTGGLEMADVTLHTLRHTCASRLVQAGMDLYRVQAWLGHSSSTITERYAHLSPAHLAEGAAMLEPTVPQSAESLR